MTMMMMMTLMAAAIRNYATDSCLIMFVFSVFLVVSFVLFLDFVYIGE